MVNSPFFLPLVGGMLIGLSASILYACNGRIAGISGILGRLVRKKPNPQWRILFLAGLLTGGVLFLFLTPEQFIIEVQRSVIVFLMAGTFVGFGTQLANGCTSGHGVCGLSRLSLRSLSATLMFMTTGILTVWLINYFWEGKI